MRKHRSASKRLNTNRMLFVGLVLDQSDTDLGPNVKNSVIVDKSSYDFSGFNSLTFSRNHEYPILYNGDLRLDGHQFSVVRTTVNKGSLHFSKNLSNGNFGHSCDFGSTSGTSSVTSLRKVRERTPDIPDPKLLSVQHRHPRERKQSGHKICQRHD